MQDFKLTFTNLSASEQLELCHRTVRSVEKLPEDQRGGTVLAELSATVQAAAESHDRIGSLRQELKAEVSRRKALLATARKEVRNASSLVAVAASFEPLKMVEAGLELRRPQTVRVGKPAAPESFTATPTLNDGEIRLRYKRPLRRCWFEVEIKTDEPGNEFKHYDIFLKQTGVAKGLTSGVRYWFRVRAENANGKGPWSNPACARAR